MKKISPPPRGRRRQRKTTQTASLTLYRYSPFSGTKNGVHLSSGAEEVIKAEINDPWGTISRNAIPKPRIYRFPPNSGQRPGTRIVVVGHPPHRREDPFTLDEIETFLRRRTFVGLTRERKTRPRILLTVTGEEKELAFGFPELSVQADDATKLVNETEEGKKPGTNVRLRVTMKGFYTWDEEKHGLTNDSLNTGLILSVKGIPYFPLDMEQYGSQSLRTANPGVKKCCLIVECDQIQEEMNISRSALVDSEMTDLLKTTVAAVFQRIESSQEYLDFRQVAVPVPWHSPIPKDQCPKRKAWSQRPPPSPLLKLPLLLFRMPCSSSWT